jgi:hypothetical protein
MLDLLLGPDTLYGPRDISSQRHRRNGSGAEGHTVAHLLRADPPGPTS